MNINRKFREFVVRFKQLNGNPHYIALGMAIGVFISITPTIPFHTVIAVALAFICRASKPAAMIGVWFSNPITIAPFYYGSYKIGALLTGVRLPFDGSCLQISQMLEHGYELTVAMLVGGIILAVIPGIAAYWVTRKLMMRIQRRTLKKS